MRSSMIAARHLIAGVRKGDTSLFVSIDILSLLDIYKNTY